MYNVIYNTIYIKPCDSWKQRGVEMEEMEHSRAGILQILRRRKNLDKDHSSEDPRAPLEDRRTDWSHVRRWIRTEETTNNCEGEQKWREGEIYKEGMSFSKNKSSFLDRLMKEKV